MSMHAYKSILGAGLLIKFELFRIDSSSIGFKITFTSIAYRGVESIIQLIMLINYTEQKK